MVLIDFYIYHGTIVCTYIMVFIWYTCRKVPKSAMVQMNYQYQYYGVYSKVLFDTTNVPWYYHSTFWVLQDI